VDALPTSGGSSPACAPTAAGIANASFGSGGQGNVSGASGAADASQPQSQI